MHVLDNIPFMMGISITGGSVDRRDFVVALGSLSVRKGSPASQIRAESTARPVIVEAGRRIDASDSQVARFPKANITPVSESIKRLLAKRNPLTVVCSAACGADLLLLQAAREMHIDQVVLLPSDPETFRSSSVTDRPGDWGKLYDEVLKTARVEILKLPEGQEGYLETNVKLLDRGQQIARDYKATAEALVIWNGVSRGPDDVTAHFIEQAELRKMSVSEISTVMSAAPSGGEAVGPGT